MQAQTPNPPAAIAFMLTATAFIAAFLENGGANDDAELADELAALISDPEMRAAAVASASAEPTLPE